VFWGGPLTDLSSERPSRNSRISVSLTEDELVQFQAIAVAQGRSMSNLCYQLIQAYLNNPNLSR
jgi:hypothetical protein